MPRDGQACRRGHVVRRHVVRGAQFAHRHRVVAENGASQPLTLDHSFVQKTLYDKPPASRGPLEVSDVTRSGVKLSWLALTSNGETEIVAYVIERPENLSPTWTHVARVRPQTDANLAEKTDCQFCVSVENVEICQTDGCQIIFAADGWCRLWNTSR